ncbi:MAG: hypothetical protein M4579_006841 [Chaenotheca gracillima]|nr:MAG: hypothetical protein M4579_006841 [Chaenotheca gracillima]
MATYNDLYQRPASRQVDTKTQKWFDDEDSSVLDDGILDGGVDAAGIFSPKNLSGGEWADFDQDIVTASSSTNPFFRHNNPFAYEQPAKSWESGSCTPTAVYDGFPNDFERTNSVSYMASNTPTQGSTLVENHSRLDSKPAPHYPPPESSTNASLPTSPLSSKDWSASMPEPLETRSLPKRHRPGSPMLSHSLLRRDGIRKKNARFEIPAERNLLNIDQLIAQSGDDQEIKELKQQKRLLRNRQAALDSRQRKKQHTERLEDEKKQYTTVITDLEERCAHLEVNEAEHRQQEQEWKSTQQRVEQYIHGLSMEKEEMIRQHTLETGELRKKNAILTEHVQNLQKMDNSTAMSAVPSSSGFSADFSDVDGLAVEPNPWDSFSFLNDFGDDSDIKSKDALVVPSRRMEKVAITDDEKPAASGLLLVLLLCGAFVASQSSTTSTPNIPRMPEDIRAASATVLDNIFKDAGVHAGNPHLAHANRVQNLEPVSSSASAAWPARSKNVFTTTEANMVGFSGSSLDVLNHQIMRPTKEQEQEQIFSLSAEQYNGITSQDFLRRPEPSSGLASRSRRDLGSSLAAMRDDHNKASAAEVYTRSLLLDKIPAEVVRDFAKLVAESNNARGTGDEIHT